jgi:DNA-binding NtrC family response regulator
VPDIHPSMLSDGLPDHLRLLVNDLVQRALVLADHPGFFEELLELAARSAGAERGLIASATAQGVITALATYCDEPREDEGFLLERRTISAAIEDQSPRQSLLPSGKATLYLPVKLSPEISHVLYLESAAGRIFHQRDVDILGAFFTVLANVLTSPSTDNLIRTRDVGAQSFRWGTRLVGNGRQMRELRRQVLTWALREEDILLLGETGTGKSRVAEAVHEVSRRRNGPFCVVELPALGPHVIESELFGHVKGSFTGASAAHTGAFEAAHGGTLFLDEIGDISLEIQGKLRRAIERKEITRIGSVDPIRVDVRVITATNRDLLADVERGTFRRDLYERLGPTIRLPSLRGRKGDILLLLHYCLDECGGPVQAVAHSVVQGLLDYNWPGNVRELQRVVTEMTARTRGMVFTWDLPEMPPDDWMGGDTQDQQDHVPSLRNIEKQAIRETLKSCGWNKTRAARALGISRQTLHTKIRAYDLVIPAYDKWAN